MSTSRPRPERVLDALLVVLVGAQLVELWTTRRSAAGVAVVVLVVVATGVLLLRGRVPLAAVVISLGSFASLIQLVPSSLSTTFLSLLLALAVAGSLPRLPAVVGLLGGWAVAVEGAWLDRYGAGVGDFAMSAALMAGVWTCGLLVSRSVRSAALTAAEAEAERRSRHESAERAVAQERGRMTRELHDVVAHGLTVLVVQTVAARQDLADGAPVAAVDRRLAATEEVARESLLELRTLLDLLGTPDQSPARTGLDGLRALADRLASPDFPVDLRVDGDLGDLGQGLDLALYRTVQEGLTNAVKHGDGRGASVRVSRTPLALTVEIGNGVIGTPSRVTGSGRGLPGLQERLGQHGGSLTATRENGRFVLRGELPVVQPTVAAGS